MLLSYNYTGNGKLLEIAIRVATQSVGFKMKVDMVDAKCEVQNESGHGRRFSFSIAWYNNKSKETGSGAKLLIISSIKNFLSST